MIFFGISLIFALFLPIFFPSLQLTCFAPALVLFYYRKSLISCLWLSLLCGMIIDLLSAKYRLGLFALNYAITTRLLYEQKRHFFEDNFSTLPIMTFFFGIITTLIQAAFSYFTERGLYISGGWVAVNLGVMPLVDAFYALLFFSLPLLLLRGKGRPGKEYFLK